jgi:hypothetical protein
MYVVMIKGLFILRKNGACGNEEDKKEDLLHR